MLPFNAASCWLLFSPRLTHIYTHSRTPLLLVGSVTSRGVQNGMQTGGGGGDGEADSAALGCPD